MSHVTFFCMTATPFDHTGAIDEGAFRALLHRLIDARLGVYVGSGGSGEGHALSHQELRRLYQIAVEECRGKVPVHANPPEQHTAPSTIAHARLAVEAGIEVIHMYTLAGWHGMKPTDAELIAYVDDVFKEIKHPIAFAMNHTMGYIPKPSLVARICKKHAQVVTVKLTGVPDTYQIALRDELGDKMSFHVLVPASVTGLLLGADGVFGSESNLMPQTYRRYLDSYEAGNFKDVADVYAQLRRCGDYVNKWGPSNPRWLKMAMKVLKLPGGEHGPRGPYLLPEQDELERFSAGLLKLGIPEINERARSVGLA